MIKIFRTFSSADVINQQPLIYATQNTVRSVLKNHQNSLEKRDFH